MSPLFTCKLPRKGMIKQYLLWKAVNHIQCLSKIWGIQCIPTQPKQVVQRENNNESKSRQSIPTSNFII